MNRYNLQNIPKKGTAKKIWEALSPDIVELHYNPNLWGRDKYSGWGKWGCQYQGDLWWCGIDKEGDVYVQQMFVPFMQIKIKPKTVSDGEK